MAGLVLITKARGGMIGFTRHMRHSRPIRRLAHITRGVSVKHRGLGSWSRRGMRCGQQGRSLHQTTPRRNPIFVRIGAVIAGRIVRSWVKDYLRGVPKAKRRLYVVGATATFVVSTSGYLGLYYWMNLSPCPITGRNRFLSVSREKELEIAKQVSKDQAGNLRKMNVKEVPASDPRVQRLVDICVRLIKAIPSVEDAMEQELDQEVLDTMEWSVTLLESDKKNAHVLPNGEIYVFTGMLDVCGPGREGDAKLAAVIGHEISHALLRHGGERMSQSQLVLAAQSGLSFILWALVPDGFFDFLHLRAVFGLEAIQQYILQVIMALPNSREQESEADYLGLMLSSAACYDPAQAPELWVDMNDLMEKAGIEQPLEMLSTHPDSLKRAEQLRKWQGEAKSVREFCGCSGHQNVKFLLGWW
eukprot:CAMPEP_0114494774 /NCGR_PEP_ID=MMETSP0109-20121206/4836_1 /TAXON_ID=29199 /ORGANISM="Chlorarachnion reptans, Strain CCCM449" /LENGTH=415 /DNA_ID=CAMNT_0001671843 /DNA_START=72 /DNA_END=1319 /DNA_ORIENTATION=+